MTKQRFEKKYFHYVNQSRDGIHRGNDIQFFVQDTETGHHFRVPAPWENPEGRESMKYLNWKCQEYLLDAEEYKKLTDEYKNNKGDRNGKGDGILSILGSILTGKSRSSRLSNCQGMS